MRRLRWLFSLVRRGPRFDDELRVELETHLAERADALVREQGLTPAEARRQARLEFGSIASYREQAREAGGLPWLDDLGRDLRYAARSLRARPAYTLTALVATALAIGVTTAIFSAVNALVLRPLPFPDPDRLVQILGTSPSFPDGEGLGHLEAYREAASLDALAGYDVGARYLGGAGGPARIVAVRTEPDFFAVLGVSALRGRTYDAGDATDVAVVGEAFWRGRLQADPESVGRSVVLDGEPYTVVGIMAESFRFPYGAASLLPGVATEATADVWIPFPQAPARLGSVIARVKPGVPLDAAAGELRAIAARLAAEFPGSNAGRSVRLVPLARAVVSPDVRAVLFVLLAAAGLVLALALATLANLALVDALRRRREIDLRRALGAGGVRLARQFLAESVVLAVAGGTAGLGLAWWGGGRLAALAATRVPRARELSVDWRVFAFVAAICAITTLVTGTAPLVASARRRGGGALGAGSGWSTIGRPQRLVRDSLVVAQVALACVLAVGAALLVRELWRLRHEDSGLTTRNVLTAHVGRPVALGAGPRPDERETRQFYEIAARVAALPGVTAAGFTQLLPLQTWGWTSNSTDFRPFGLPLVAAFPIEMRYITPGYFDAMGIPLRGGRAFDDGDDARAPAVVIANETLARLAFGDRSPVGVPTNRGTIVGIAADVRQAHLGRPAAPELYFPVAQNWSQLSELGMTLVARTDGSPAAGALMDAVAAIVREVNPGNAIFNVRTMDGVVDDSLADFRLYLRLMLIFALTAGAMAAAGTYGVIAYAAASRRREFAVRLALGATRGRLRNLVLRSGLTLSATGAAIGAAATYAAAPLLARLPIDVGRPDVVLVVPVGLAIAVLTLAACLAPARRAARIEPMDALRCE